MKNVPDRIFLNLGDYNEEYTEEDDFDELGEVTWCKDKIFPNDIEYVRKDVLLEILSGYEDTDRISVETLLDKLNSL